MIGHQTVAHRPGAAQTAHRAGHSSRAGTHGGESRPTRERLPPALFEGVEPRTSAPAIVALVAGVTLALAPSPVAAQEPGSVVDSDPRVEARSYVFEETGAEVPYALFVPSTYDPDHEWPLIVGLHGLGRPYDWLMGYEGMIDLAEERGYILVTPRGYHPRGWYGSRGTGIPPMPDEVDPDTLPSNLGELSQQDVMNVLEIVRGELSVDPDRIYLWGHSMGGAGTYHLAAQHPTVWVGLAVAAPAPFTSPWDQIPAFRHIPVLVMHGDEDGVVPVERSREWVRAMGELGMEHLYVEVPGGDHSSFINADRAMVAKIFGFFDVVRKEEREPLR